MVDKIDFQWTWDDDIDRQFVGFSATVDGHPVRCGIAYEALERHFGGFKKGVVQSAVDNRETIETIATNMIHAHKVAEGPHGAELVIYLADCDGRYR